MLEWISQGVMTVGFLLLVAWIIKILWEGKRTRLKSELHHKLMDKFATGQEMSEFLQSESGNNFLDSMKLKGEVRMEATIVKDKLLKSISLGIILASLGAATMLVGKLFEKETQYAFASGLIILILSIGFLISSAVSYALSKKWGLFDKE